MKENHQIASKIIHKIENDDDRQQNTSNTNNTFCEEEEESGNVGNSEGQSITLVAQSVTSLAQAVKNLQTQLQSIDERIQNHEQQLQSLLLLQNQQQQEQVMMKQEVQKISKTEEECMNISDINKLAKYNNVNDIQKRIEHDQKKKKDFIKAYKSVISIVKALKVLPEIKQVMNSQNIQQQHQQGMNHNTNINNNDIAASVNHDIDNSMIPQIIIENNDNRNATTMLRNIALTLSDVDTIASYVSNNTISNTHPNNDNSHYDDDDNLTITDDTNSTLQLKLHKQEEQYHGVIHHSNKMDMVLIERMLKQHSNNSFRLQIGLTLLCCTIIIVLNFTLFQNHHYFHRYKGTGMIIHDDLRDNGNIISVDSEMEVGMMKENVDSTSVERESIQEAGHVQNVEGDSDDAYGETGDGDEEEDESLSQTVHLSVEQDGEMMVDQKDNHDLLEPTQDAQSELLKTDNDRNFDNHEHEKLKFSWLHILAKAYLCDSYEDSEIISITNLCF